MLAIKNINQFFSYIEPDTGKFPSRIIFSHDDWDILKCYSYEFDLIYPKKDEHDYQYVIYKLDDSMTRIFLVMPYNGRDHISPYYVEFNEVEKKHVKCKSDEHVITQICKKTVEVGRDIGLETEMNFIDGHIILFNTFLNASLIGSYNYIKGSEVNFILNLFKITPFTKTYDFYRDLKMEVYLTNIRRSKVRFFYKNSKGETQLIDTISCIHPMILQGTLEELQDGTAKIVSNEKKQVKLAPKDQFFALCSWAQYIAERNTVEDIMEMIMSETDRDRLYDQLRYCDYAVIDMLIPRIVRIILCVYPYDFIWEYFEMVDRRRIYQGVESTSYVLATLTPILLALVGGGHNSVIKGLWERYPRLMSIVALMDKEEWMGWSLSKHLISEGKSIFVKICNDLDEKLFVKFLDENPEFRIPE